MDKSFKVPNVPPTPSPTSSNSSFGITNGYDSSSPGPGTQTPTSTTEPPVYYAPFTLTRPAVIPHSALPWPEQSEDGMDFKKKRNAPNINFFPRIDQFTGLPLNLSPGPSSTPFQGTGPKEAARFLHDVDAGLISKLNVAWALGEGLPPFSDPDSTKVEKKMLNEWQIELEDLRLVIRKHALDREMGARAWMAAEEKRAQQQRKTNMFRNLGFVLGYKKDEDIEDEEL